MLRNLPARWIRGASGKTWLCRQSEQTSWEKAILLQIESFLQLMNKMSEGRLDVRADDVCKLIEFVTKNAYKAKDGDTQVGSVTLVIKIFVQKNS